PNGTLIDTYEMTQNGDTFTYTWSTEGYELNENYNFTIIATDVSGNVNDTEGDTFAIEDTESPEVTDIVAEEPVEYGTELNVNATVTDTHELETVNIEFYYPNGTLIDNYEMTQNGDTFTYTWSTEGYELNENYNFTIIAEDVSGNVNDTEGKTFGIVDTVPPEVTDIVADESAEYETGSISVNATVTDNHELDTVNITFYDPNATLIGTYAMDNSSGDTFTYTWDVGTYAPAEDYSFTINATDVSRNVNDTEGKTFGIVDTVPPEVTDIVADESAEYETGSISVNATVTDNHELDTVNITFYEPDGTLIGTYEMTQNGDTFTYTWEVGTYAPEEGYNFTIIATDVSGNVNDTEGKTFAIEDTVPPEVTDIVANDWVKYETGEFYVEATVTDNHELDTVNITFYDPNATLIGTYEMENPSGDTFNYTWSVESYDQGNYSFILNATDLSGNVNDTEGGTFEIGSHVALQIGDDTNIIENTGYIGEDNLTFLVAFRAYDEDGVGADVENITITNITVRFGNDGEYNEHFTFEAYNDTRIEDGLDLEGSEDYTWVEINYTINPLAPMEENFMDEEVWIDIEYEYEEKTESDEFRIEDRPGITASVDLYEIPEIAQLEMETTPELADGYWLPENHEITFRINGTHLEGKDYYEAWINLTAWNIGETVVKASWDGNYYSCEITNLETAEYNASELDVILNTTDSFTETTGLRYENDTANFDENFEVDANAPIIDIDPIDFPETTDHTGFLVSFNLTDDESGVGSAEILVKADEDYWIDLEQSESDDDIWEVMLTQENLGSESFEYEAEITISDLTAQDVSGNENETSIGRTVEVDDTTAPVFDLETLEIDGLTGETEFPADQYLTLQINVSEDTASSSGIYYVRVYYRIDGDTSAENEWEYIKLVHKGDGVYFGILSGSDQVGFTADQEVTFKIRVSDFAENVRETEEIKLTFTEEDPILSYVVLFGSLISFTGAMIYRIGFYRKKAKILDVEKVMTKQKTKTTKK
ncbi:MAG: hypothetical protein R6U96_08700, partial [Promethearchaeia archaeon]